MSIYCSYYFNYFTTSYLTFINLYEFYFYFKSNNHLIIERLFQHLSLGNIIALEFCRFLILSKTFSMKQIRWLFDAANAAGHTQSDIRRLGKSIAVSH